MKRRMRTGALSTAAWIALAALAPGAEAQRPGVAEQLPAGAPPAVQACVGCHGAQGQGNPQAGVPRIAGQTPRYLLKQLESYADGRRRSPVMEPIARGLPPEIRAEVVRYFAQTLVRAVESGTGGESPPERGRVLAEEGDNALGVQGCRNCHGPGGVGEPPNIPYIAGLDADYIVHELNAFKEGTRTNDAGQQMLTVATALPRADIEAVARYYASQPPPEPAPLNLVQSPPPQRPVLQVQRIGPRGGGAATRGSDLSQPESAAIDRPQEREADRERAPPRAPAAAQPQGDAGAGSKQAGGGVQQEAAQREDRVGVDQGSPSTGGNQGQGGPRPSATPGKKQNGGGGQDQARTGGNQGRGADSGSETGKGAAAPQRGSQRASDAGGQPGAGQGEGEEQQPRWPATIDEPAQEQEPQSFAPSVPGDPERGRAIVASGEYGCPACHTIPDIDNARGIVGPPLTDFGRRALIAGRLPNDPQTLAAFVFNAPAMVPDTGMPNLGLSFQEARNVAAYLRTLGTGNDG